MNHDQTQQMIIGVKSNEVSGGFLFLQSSLCHTSFTAILASKEPCYCWAVVALNPKPSHWAEERPQRSHLSFSSADEAPRALLLQQRQRFPVNDLFTLGNATSVQTGPGQPIPPLHPAGLAPSCAPR